MGHRPGLTVFLDYRAIGESECSRIREIVDCARWSFEKVMAVHKRHVRVGKFERKARRWGIACPSNCEGGGLRHECAVRVRDVVTRSDGLVSALG
jgi:hypothetical protein